MAIATCSASESKRPRSELRYNVRRGVRRGLQVLPALLPFGRMGRIGLKNRWLVMVALTVLAMAPSVLAQDAPEKGGHELQFWTGGGTSRNGGVRDIGIWNAGFRFGWILTEAHGPKGLRGRFEYALDATPIFWFFQPGGTAYGAGVSPVVLKWNFDAGSRVVPYVEANGAFVVSTRAAPPGAGHANFASSAAIGTHLLGKRGGNLSVEIRLMHVSDAGLTTYNPGINTLQVRIGLGRFFHSN
jgi:hypothetical protein